MTILRSGFHKAKKEHRCNFCNGIIPVGEEYEYQVIKGDGFYVWRSHTRCSWIANKLDMYNECEDGVTSDDFQEYINREFFDLQGDEQNPSYMEFKERLDFVYEHYKNIT